MNDEKNFTLKACVDNLKSSHLSLDRIVAALLSGFMLAYICQMFINGNFHDLQAYYSSLKFPLFWAAAVLGSATLLGVTYLLKSKSLIPRALLVLTVVLSMMFSLNFTENGVYFILGLAVVDFVIIKWIAKDDKAALADIKISFKTCFVAAVMLFVAFSVMFGYYTSLRYSAYVNSTFDFGIFAQMFEKMAATGRADTTVERSVLMSHFGVHFSPIFYLFLPFYYIFRSPLCLFYIQSIFVAGGVFAVYLICKKLGLSEKVTLCFEFIYILYPSLFNGCFYDFHENKFLTVIILFLFYFILCDKTLWMFVFSLLLLSVKEDAAVYLIVIALFVMINRKKIIKGSVMLAMAVLYFLIAQNIVAAMGEEGVMIWRLSDYFVNGEKSFFSVLKSIVYDAGFLIKQMFTAEKIPFVIWMLLPVMFTPFMTDKISSLLLLLPMIPINLMQSWQYQYNVDYQYTYGVAALIIVSAIFAVVRLKTGTRHFVVLMMLCMCTVMSASLTLPKIKRNIGYMNSAQASAKLVDEALKIIPKDCSVTASYRIMPHLYYVDEVYTVPDYYGDLQETDYYAVDTRDNDNADAIAAAMGDKYSLVKNAGFVNIYQHK